MMNCGSRHASTDPFRVEIGRDGVGASFAWRVSVVAASDAGVKTVTLAGEGAPSATPA